MYRVKLDNVTAVVIYHLKGSKYPHKHSWLPINSIHLKLWIMCGHMIIMNQTFYRVSWSNQSKPKLHHIFNGKNYCLGSGSNENCSSAPFLRSPVLVGIMWHFRWTRSTSSCRHVSATFILALRIIFVTSIHFVIIPKSLQIKLFKLIKAKYYFSQLPWHEQTNGRKAQSLRFLTGSHIATVIF